ncbi:nuclear transport factor 2 family protein [Baekduia alba]|uniref:nuclear transport factor 2 family protein n=1 Tax=Baekduia alba TaxID=2997333 RepID=UPI002341A768|nr:nuclear transport factor 2 family protein [Baekduia alba]
MDQPFFSALLAGDATALGALLTDDFILVDVMAGGVIDRASLLDVVGSGQMTFESIETPTPASARSYGDATMVTIGETRMSGRFGDEAWSAHSRYTHVFVRADASSPWLLASAQGTQIAE